MTPSSPFPTEAQHFKGRYKVSVGIAFLLIGTVTVLLSLWRIGLDGLRRPVLLGLVLGIVVTLLGMVYLTRPYFGVAPNRLTVYSLLGKTVKRYPFASFNHLKIEDGHLYVESSDVAEGNRREKVKISKWMVRSDDWQRLQRITTL